MTTATVRAMKLADESRGDAFSTLTIDSTLFVDLEANTEYWIEAGIMMWTSTLYGHFLDHNFQYDGVLYDPGVHLSHREMPCCYVSLYEDREGMNNRVITGQVGLATTYSMFNDFAESPYVRGMLWLSGRITTVDAGRFGFYWKHRDSGPASPSRVLTGSWLYATPLDICPI